MKSIFWLAMAVFLFLFLPILLSSAAGNPLQAAQAPASRLPISSTSNTLQGSLQSSWGNTATLTSTLYLPVVFEYYPFGWYTVPGIQPADLDLDGDVDLILGSEENNSIIQVYENLGNARFRNSNTVFEFTSPDSRHWNFGITVADFNGDTLPDIATADGWAGMNVYFNRGGLDFDLVQNYTFIGMGEVKGIANADLDKDGDIDIILGDHNGDSRGDRVLFNDGSGWMVDSGQSIGLDVTVDLFAIDLNHDNAPDYISINRYAGEPTRVHFNNGSGFFTTTVDVPDAMDDSDDIQCFAYGENSYCFIANAEGTTKRLNRMLVFDANGTIIVNKGFGTAGAETKGFCLADLNADNYLDLVSANFGLDSLVNYLAPGPGGLLDLAGSQTLFTVLGTTFIGCADFNGDGTTDFVLGFWLPGVQQNEYRLILQEPPG